MFAGVFNAERGQTEWVEVGEEEACSSLVVHSTHLDMLNDHDRNVKYMRGIVKAVEGLCKAHLPVNVVDIGAGSGLLSMLAARAAENNGCTSRVCAFELFKPMAEVARQIIERNGHAGSIRVVSRRSDECSASDLQWSDGNSSLGHLVVTEIFDTELLGEGIIPALRHAHGSLLSDCALTVPSSAVLYAQPVHWPFVRKWHRFAEQSNIQGVSLRYTVREEAACSGTATPISVHYHRTSSFAELPTPLGPCREVFSFNFTKPIQDGRSVVLNVPVSGGACDAVLTWWEICTAPMGVSEIEREFYTISTHPTKGAWRDHWRQALYLLPPRAASPNTSDSLKLRAFHDDFTVWFSGEDHTGGNVPPACDCLMHVLCGSQRIWMLNCAVHRAQMERAARIVCAHVQNASGSSCVIDIGDGSLLGLSIASMLRAQENAHVLCLEQSMLSSRLVQKISRENNLLSRVRVVHASGVEEVLRAVEQATFGEEQNGKLFVVSEPYSYAPDEIGLHFAERYLRSLLSIAMLLNGRGTERVIVSPWSISLHAVPVRFAEFHRSYQYLASKERETTSNDYNTIGREDHNGVLGLDITQFNQLHATLPVLAVNTWMYEYEALCEDKCLLQIDCESIVNDCSVKERQSGGSFVVEQRGAIHAVLLWMEFHMAHDCEATVSTRSRSAEQGYWKQGVHFLPQPWPNVGEGGRITIHYDVKMGLGVGEDEANEHTVSSMFKFGFGVGQHL